MLPASAKILLRKCRDKMYFHIVASAFYLPQRKMLKFEGCKLIKAKAISLLPLFFLYSFLIIKPQSSHQNCSIKKQSLKVLEYAQENVFESLFNKRMFTDRGIFRTKSNIYDGAFMQK